MNALVLMIPLLFIRFGLLGVLHRESLGRAAFFPPMDGARRIAYLCYQVSNVFLVFYLFFLRIQTQLPLSLAAGLVYALGILALCVSTVNFAKPNGSGINTNGLYRVSRNPMYVGYFLYYLGCVLFTRSLLLFLALLIFQISTHFLILAEEAWCIKTFGEAYIRYMNRVRRYL